MPATMAQNGSRAVVKSAPNRSPLCGCVVHQDRSAWDAQNRHAGRPEEQRSTARCRRRRRCWQAGPSDDLWADAGKHCASVARLRRRVPGRLDVPQRRIKQPQTRPRRCPPAQCVIAADCHRSPVRLGTAQTSGQRCVATGRAPGSDWAPPEPRARLAHCRYRLDSTYTGGGDGPSQRASTR